MLLLVLRLVRLLLVLRLLLLVLLLLLAVGRLGHALPCRRGCCIASAVRVSTVGWTGQTSALPFAGRVRLTSSGRAILAPPEGGLRHLD